MMPATRSPAAHTSFYTLLRLPFRSWRCPAEHDGADGDDDVVNGDDEVALSSILQTALSS